MGTSPTTGTRSTGRDGVASFDTRTGSERLSTETKAGPKTTEFIAYIAVLVGVLIAGLVIEDDGGQDFFTADKVWLYATVLTVGYMISRGLAKSGSRDPYFRDGTNQNHDND